MTARLLHQNETVHSGDGCVMHVFTGQGDASQKMEIEMERASSSTMVGVNSQATDPSARCPFFSSPIRPVSVHMSACPAARPGPKPNVRTRALPSVVQPPVQVEGALRDVRSDPPGVLALGVAQSLRGWAYPL